MNDIPLYPSEAQISRKVLGPGRLDEWKGIVTVWERHGLPPIDPMTGGRYWPAVRAYLDRRNGLGDPRQGLRGYAPDGGETAPEPRRRK